MLALKLEGNLSFLLSFTLYLRAISKYKSPGREGGWAYIWKGYLTEGFLRYEFGGLIFGGANIEELIFGILRYAVSVCRFRYWFRVHGRPIRIRKYAVSKVSGFVWTKP